MCLYHPVKTGDFNNHKKSWKKGRGFKKAFGFICIMEVMFYFTV